MKDVNIVTEKKSSILDNLTLIFDNPNGLKKLISDYKYILSRHNNKNINALKKIDKTIQ